MAITKIHAIKVRLGDAITYIENPDKTDGQELWNAVQELQMPKSLENSWAAWLIMVYIQLLTLINKSVHINAKK